MFKKVTSQKEQEAFAATWEYFCERNGWHKDPYAQTGERYQLLLSKRDPTVIGTIEFIPYHEEVEVERYFRFSKIPSIFQQQERVWEIDKLCLHKDYHRQGYFFHFFEIIYDHALLHQPKYYIAILEKKLYRLLKMSVGRRMIRVDKQTVRSEASLIPVVIQIEQIMKDDTILQSLLLRRNKLLLWKYFFRTGLNRLKNKAVRILRG